MGSESSESQDEFEEKPCNEKSLSEVFDSHSFSAGMQRRDAFHFVFKRRYRYTERSHMLGERHK